MTLRSKVLTCAAIAALTIGSAAMGVVLEVVTNDAGSPGGQPVDASCVREGTFGMRITNEADGDFAFVQAGSDQGFNNETVLRQEFWFNPQNVTMDNGARFQNLVSLQAGAGQRPVRAVVRFSNSAGYTISAQCVRNCGSSPCSYQSSGVVSLAPDSWSRIRMEWMQNTLPAPAPGDGICSISILEGPTAPASATRNNMRNSQYTVGRARMGVQGPIRPSTAGAVCFDSYQAFRTLASP